MQFVADLDNLDEMMLYIHKEAEKSGMQEKLIHKMELACEEALVNIISYAYPNKKGVLLIDCTLKGNRFEITLLDKGVPFNQIDAEINPQLEKPVSERKIGGLGIYLLRKTIDEASYQRINNTNLLRLTFALLATSSS